METLNAFFNVEEFEREIFFSFFFFGKCQLILQAKLTFVFLWLPSFRTPLAIFAETPPLTEAENVGCLLSQPTLHSMEA